MLLALCSPSDVHKATFRLKPLTVSKKSDSVRCESFVFNPAGSSDDYHVIALAPIANISGVVARMMMYVCKGECQPSRDDECYSLVHRGSYHHEII